MLLDSPPLEFTWRPQRDFLQIFFECLFCSRLIVVLASFESRHYIVIAASFTVKMSSQIVHKEPHCCWELWKAFLWRKLKIGILEQVIVSCSDGGFLGTSDFFFFGCFELVAVFPQRGTHRVPTIITFS